MKKPNYLLFILFSFLTIQLFSQKTAIRGSVSDTLEHRNLEHAVVSLLRSKDSLLIKFNRTDNKGNFELTNLKAGKYFLLVSYPEYADYTDDILLNDSSQINLNQLPMITKEHLLKEVVVRQTIGAIKMKGDTTEFKADSFHLQANANVEELLKKLPGIQVDKNGKITAQGEKVQKVLVDGEEFFGDDPTLVTQNIRADMVDKVQVYDKKSEQATFTGIEDGEKSKTINLKLKADKKKGYFGKLSSGAGSDGYQENQDMINYFKKKEKLAAFGIVSNTGKTGLNWQDQNSYGDGSGGGLMIVDGEIMGSSSYDDITGWEGNYNGQGKPLVQTGGLHFNNKWNDDKQSLNLNYKVINLSVDGSSTTNSEYILPDTLYYNNQSQTFSNIVLRNKLGGTYEFLYDSSSSLKITTEGQIEHKNTINNYNSNALSETGNLVNTGSRNLTANADNNFLNADILWRKKLKKKGRTISIDVKENYLVRSSTGNLYALDNFYTPGITNPSLTELTDQYKSNHNSSLSLDAKTVYTEPLSASSSLMANYEVITNNSISYRNSFNKDTNGKYDLLDTTYSNNYGFNIFTQKTGLAYSITKKKFWFNIGSNIGFTELSQLDKVTTLKTNRGFTDWYPQTYAGYSFNNQERLMFNYSGKTTQPSLQQIQPLHSNDDPLNIIIGNPTLRPSFSNDVRFTYFNSKPISNQFLYSSILYRFSENAFSNNESIDSIGRRTTQVINVNGNYSIEGYLDYSFKLKKIGLNIDLNGNINTNRNANLVNNELNITRSENYTTGFSIGKTVDKVYDNSINANATYTTSTSSIQNSLTTHYWTYTVTPNFDFYIPHHFQLHTDCNFTIRQKTSVFTTNNNVILWNAWFGKKLLKNDALLLKIAANDILNQNKGFSRTENTNIITQNTYTSIKRYLMLSVVWNFSKNGPKAN